jgi:hypothetical protein
MKLINILKEMSVKKSKLPDGGDCFNVAFDYIIKHGSTNKNLMLVHGFVSGQGKLSGKRYTHAWCEDGDNVIDISNGNKFEILKMIYYGIGNVNPNQGKYYTYEEAIDLSSKYGTKGPWEIENKVYDEKFNSKTGFYD